jgi:hypothetical protein
MAGISAGSIETCFRGNMKSYLVRRHSTTTRHACVTCVTAASHGCGKKRTTSSARRTVLPVKIMLAKLNGKHFFIDILCYIHICCPQKTHNATLFYRGTCIQGRRHLVTAATSVVMRIPIVVRHNKTRYCCYLAVTVSRT